ncbi:YggS family pyridoxal phosphate-dependent enzyme [Methanococcoides orientis]|uniref:YggS family pyridoxal phosphate-dependent enzyme n=1 Tax=Methanococcoides orientis TaxID=2822137 RepID=UPI001E4A4B36|nr:YggS family pyridoxal phosphate-dependent enzyme [Methanococcoides orientis]UGV41593.1 YggS family pyridoxal phosphate-dependent enzyme [Methanococcoides orientis]
MTVDENVKMILKELGSIKLVSVTKTIDPDRINESIKAGATIIGENRVQEFEDKCDEILPCERHLIGHLQTNKVKKAVQHFDVIQSVDSLKLIQDIDKKAKDINKVQKVFLQINIGNEPQKFGFGSDEIDQVLTEIHSLKNIDVKGLMCIPPYVSPEQTRSYFKKMKALFDEIKQVDQNNIDIQELSMGMSNDYRIAIEEGATMVRVGSAIFGNRKY